MRQDDHALLLIGFCVVCLHAGGLYWLTMGSTPHVPVPPPRCQVTTVLLQPKNNTKTSLQPKSNSKIQKTGPKAEKRTEKPRPSEKKKKHSPPKKETLSKKNKTALDKKKQILNAAKEKINGMKKNSKQEDLGEIQFLNIEALSSGTYAEMLSASLRQKLRLPEVGNVDIKLTLDREGHVTGLETMHAVSSLNRSYLENTLPFLRFPPFGNHFCGEKEHTFFVTLTHDA